MARRVQQQGQTGRSKKAGSWMRASPAAYLGIIMGVVGLGSTFTQWIFTYADLRSSVVTLSRDLERNFREDASHTERQMKSIESINATIGNMGELKVQIEVMKTQLGTINETLKDIRRQLERAHVVPGHIMPGTHHDTKRK